MPLHLRQQLFPIKFSICNIHLTIRMSNNEIIDILVYLKKITYEK